MNLWTEEDGILYNKPVNNNDKVSLGEGNAPASRPKGSGFKSDVNQWIFQDVKVMNSSPSG